MTSYSVGFPVENVSQPDPYTCQSACISMVTGDDVNSIRLALLAGGQAGDPYNMGRILRSKLGDRYSFIADASLRQIRGWLRDGDFLITHGWFTPSGHVIGLDGIKIDQSLMGDRISVKDPWSEFNGASFKYDLGGDFFDGFYSSYLIYATCVASGSYSHARQIYKRGELNSSLENAWVHRITK